MKWLNRRDRAVVGVPHALTLLLVLLNGAAYALCFRQSGTAVIGGDVLLRDGAMYSHALARGEYWRLIAYGFLHADGIHLAGNMICLMLWGGRLEKQIGHLYFLLIYLFSLIAGALVTDFSQPRDYLTVGASGATSGLLGALLFLGLFGKVALSAGFFVVNIGLNVALAASSSRINWAAHLGGFAAGLIGCALLDGIERANGYLLRCKFPEFVKLNGFAIVGVGAAILLGTRSPVPFSSGLGTQVLAAFAIVSLIGIKLIDLLLSMRNGLAVIAVLLAIANAALVLLWSRIFPSAATHTCEVVVMALHLLTAYVCANSMMPIPVAILVLIASLLISWANLVRGLADVGFVGNTLRGERARRNGL